MNKSIKTVAAFILGCATCYLVYQYVGEHEADVLYYIAVAFLACLVLYELFFKKKKNQN